MFQGHVPLAEKQTPWPIFQAVFPAQNLATLANKKRRNAESLSVENDCCFLFCWMFLAMFL